MKKLLFLFLLFPLLGLSQQIIYQDVIGTFPAQVNDTITVRFYLSDQTGSEDLSLLQFDISYNSKKIMPTGAIRHDAYLDGQSIVANYWSTYNFYPNSNFDANDLDGQYSAGLNYVYGNTDWNIARYSIQSAIDISGGWIEQDFIVQDIGNFYPNYTDAFHYNWAYTNIRTGGTSDIWANTRIVDLDARNYVPAGTVTIHLDLTNITNPTDYTVHIEPSSIPDSSKVVSGVIDANGNFSTLALHQNEEYKISVYVKSTWDESLQAPVHPQWLDDVVTVSDVILTFKQAIGTDPDGTGNYLTYTMQKQFANIIQNGVDDPVDFQDSYALLAHLAGILDNAAAQSSTTSATFYPITSFNNGSFNYSAKTELFGVPPTSEAEWLAQSTFTLIDDQPITINMSHGLMGDVDLSHSNIPDEAKAGNLLAKESTAKESTDVDIATQLVGNTVELTIDVAKTDLAGIQFNLRYDTDILAIKDVKFDTGNTMTNFAKKLDGKLIVGTIDPQGASTMKAGTPIKIVFETKQTITNTAGLVSFYVTDAVTKNGDKVTLNLR